MTDLLPALPVTPIPPNESERLAALHRYQVLDTPPEAAFDRLTALAARLFKTPTVLISLVDESRAMVVSELELRLAAKQIASVDAALVEITQGVSRVTGREFFDELVKHFAKVLGADYVYIGLVEGTEPKMMRTIATCDRGNIVENLEYRLQDPPCWETIEQRKICCHPRNVRAQFPNTPLLKPLAVESYISIPFCVLMVMCWDCWG